MPSTFSWLDHSDHDRRRVLDAIDRFKESDTRDELGLGSIRDGFADLFFPGTSTIQTRARYFLFVPWMYQALAEKGVANDAVAHRARKDELKLTECLLASGDADGTFGKLAGATLKRLASSIYWAGLGAWRIRLFSGSQEDYHRRFVSLHGRDQNGARDDDGDLVAGQAPRPWHPHVPPPPSDFPSVASFKLTQQEARYLGDRIVLAAPDSMLAFLVRQHRTLEADYPWAHPQVAELPAATGAALGHARLLAETMHGAAFLYNLMLAEQLPLGARREERVGAFRAAIATWCGELQSRKEAIRSWDRTAFWAVARQLATVRQPTVRFVDRWLELEPWRDPERTITDTTARALLHERERQLKGRRARLGNPRALELWGGDAGPARMNYRWPAAVRILRDLSAGKDSADA